MTDGPKKRGRLGKRLAVWLLIAVIVLVTLLIGIRAALPSLVQRGATYASQKYLGLPVKIGNVDFSLMAGKILLEKVEAGTPPGATGEKDVPPLLQVERVVLRWSWRELLHRRLVLLSLAVERPVLRMARESDGQFDPLRHAKPEAHPSKAPPPTSSSVSESWPVRIESFVLRSPKVVITDGPTGRHLLEFSLESFDLDEMSVTGGEVGLGAMAIRGPELRVHRDLIRSEAKVAAKTPPTKTAATTPPKSRFRIREVDVQRAKFTWEGREGPLDVSLMLKVAGISAEENKTFPVDMAVQIGDGKLSMKGDAGFFPPFFHGKASWRGLAFPPLLLAARPDLIEWLKSANSSGDLEVLLDTAGTEGPPAFRFSGQTSVYNVSAAAPGDNRVTVGWRQLDLDIRRGVLPFQVEGKPPRPIVANFDRISLDTPWLVYTHPASFLKLLGGGGSSPMEVSVSQLDLTEGDIKLHDTTTSSSASLSHLAVSLSNLQYPATTFSWLSLQAILPTTSRFMLEGSLGAGWTGDFTTSVQGLDLPPWNAYAKAFGVSLDAGTLSLQTKLNLNGAAIKADNEIVLSHLGLSLLNPNSFASEFGVPVDLALALLQDPAGNIRLTIPVRFDEAGTTVSKKEVAGSAVRAALLGALSSPLKLIGAGLGAVTPPGKKSKTSHGSDSILIPPLESVAGSAEPAHEVAVRVRGIVKLLAERPEITLVLRGRTGAEDRLLLAEQILLEQAAAGEKLPEIPDVGFLARRWVGEYLSKRNRGESVTLDAKDSAVYQRFVAAVEVPQARLDALSKVRAEKVKALLVAKGAKPSSLSIGDPESAGAPGVVLSFQLAPPPKKSRSQPQSR